MPTGEAEEARALAEIRTRTDKQVQVESFLAGSSELNVQKGGSFGNMALIRKEPIR